MSSKVEKLKRDNVVLTAKVSKLENKIIPLTHKVEEYKAKLAEQKAEIKIQKLDYVKKIKSLESELDEMRKKKDGATVGDIIATIAKFKKT